MPKHMTGPLALKNGGAPKGTDRRMMRTSVALLGALAALVAAEGAPAQHTDQPRPRISVASTIVAQPASQAFLAINVGPPQTLPKECFIRLRGLPPSVSLSGWHTNEMGSWTVPLFALPTLKADVPAGISGRSEILISLIAIDGSLLAEARTVLVIGPSPTHLPTEDRPSAELLIAQGEKYLVDANFDGARQLFRRAADAGLAEAALRLAATYDPIELALSQVQGVLADRAEARKWYERARELRAPEADERLARLAAEEARASLPKTQTPELASEDRVRAEQLVAQGEKYLSDANIDVARQFFRRAADAGLAGAALRLAATYDPAELVRWQVRGVVPDRSEARKWYERARVLGAPEATDRLVRLGVE
jgi:hypothetical protein